MAKPASREMTATTRCCVKTNDRLICNCSTFSVRSREVSPLWICSYPAREENSSIRALTSCKVTRSRRSMDSRSTSVMTDRYASTTASSILIPKSFWATRTATQSSRSRTTLFSADQISAISGDAYRFAKTLATRGLDPVTLHLHL